MAERSQKRKVAHSLVALSSAAILTVYAAGYVRTQAAADRLDLDAARRRAPPAPPVAPAAPPATATADIGPPPPPAASPEPSRSATPLPVSAAPGGTSGAATPRATAESTPHPAPPANVAPAAPIPSPVAPSPASPGSSPSAEAASPSPEPEESAIPAEETALEPAADLAAPAAESAPVAAEVAYRDGTYLGWGRCRHGKIQAEVTIENGRIAAARVARCQTRWACSLVDSLVPEVSLHQGPPVSYVSGASQSSDAFFFAVVDALSQAR